MPFGRDFHTVKPYETPTLNAEVLMKMRAPVDEKELQSLSTEVEGNSDDDELAGMATAPGTFLENRAESSSTYF